MRDFDEIMAREQERIAALRQGQRNLQDQIDSTEAYMRSLVEQHVTDSKGAAS